MIGKLGLLLFFLQLWQLAMPNKTIEVDPEQILLNSSYDSNFPYQFEKKLYHIETNLEVNWFQAAHNCRKLGGNLLNIESSREMDAILSIVTKDKYWISANCLSKDRDFISITSGESMPYYRWLSGEPNNNGGNEKCVEIVMYGVNDAQCSHERKYICETKLVN